MSTNTRIKKLRKALDLTQREFGERIGVKPNTIATYEIGRNQPIDAVISLICREFNVSEHWLRTGEGEMFVQLSRDEEIAAFFGEVLAGEPDTFRKQFMSMLSRLGTSDWEVLEKMAQEMVRATDQQAAEPPDQHAIWEAECRAEAEAYYQELLKRGPGSDIDAKGAEAVYEESLGIAPSAGRFVSNTTNGTDGSGEKLA